jgi:single-stranded DNA-binding protein
VVVGRLQQRTWTAEDGSARSVVEVVAKELGPSPALDDRPTNTGHHERRRIASLRYVETENVRHNVEEKGSEMPPRPRRSSASRS